ncbi:voltage-dependent calcium channel subunit alpha-2/delta-1-like [Tachypleus tridentatus]|uniref:voltage-dependent calcium channel subunit alpha-2/delta-1-like n=1 Tax=Tachypleus tridentatus TaxID=6853 RepID=UPI003FD120E1
MSRVNEVMACTSNRLIECFKGIGLMITVVIMILPTVVGSLNKRLVPDFPDENEVYQWAMKLDKSFSELFDRITGIEMLSKNYMKLSPKKKLTPLDGAALVESMSKSLADALKKKMDALQRLVDEAEDIVQNYTYDPEIERDDVHWFSMKSFTENDPRLVYEEKFRKGVNKSYSAVHIPLEIYEGYPEVLNGLKWSAALDPIFRKNAEEDKNLMWQYFGSQVGFMRTFPANKWKTANPELPDLYDVRRRPWYVHGSSSPKDMLILLDTSGSMHGQNMEIMKIAAKSLLNTLGVNDFVNVAWFSEEAGWVTCFKTFVQANRRNKRVFFNGIDALKDGDMASLSIGLEFAFKELKKFQENKDEWEGAECHQVIMVFTDGGTEEAWDVIKKWNKKKKVRIFLYAVGPHILPYATLKDIACANKGYFTAIPSMGAIRTKIQSFSRSSGRDIT